MLGLDIDQTNDHKDESQLKNSANNIKIGEISHHLKDVPGIGKK